MRVLSLSAPTADQILGDKFQLARLITPQRKPALEAPVVLAAATAPPPDQPLADVTVANAEPASAGAGELLHQASLKVVPADRPRTEPPRADRPRTEPPRAERPRTELPTPAGVDKHAKKAGEKAAWPAAAAVTRPVRTANVDPLAPLPAEQSTAKGSRTNR